MVKILGFHVFLVRAGTTYRNVYICTQVAVLHVAVTCAEVTHNLAQLTDVGGGFFGAANIGAADDLHQGHTCTVKIHETHIWVHVVDRFSGVLLKVDTLDAHNPRSSVTKLNQNLTFAHNGVIELRNLIALRQIRVEIVFPIKS